MSGIAAKLPSGRQAAQPPEGFFFATQRPTRGDLPLQPVRPLCDKTEIACYGEARYANANNASAGWRISR